MEYVFFETTASGDVLIDENGSPLVLVFDLPDGGDGGTGSGVWKAPVATAEELPLTENGVGDTRLVRDELLLYSWDGDSWEIIGLPWDNDGGEPASSVWKGPVNLLSDLPTAGNTSGDMRYVVATRRIYAWNGTQWQALADTAGSGGGGGSALIVDTEADREALVTDDLVDGDMVFVRETESAYWWNDLGGFDPPPEPGGVISGDTVLRVWTGSQLTVVRHLGAEQVVLTVPADAPIVDTGAGVTGRAIAVAFDVTQAGGIRITQPASSGGNARLSLWRQEDVGDDTYWSSNGGAFPFDPGSLNADRWYLLVHVPFGHSGSFDVTLNLAAQGSPAAVLAPGQGTGGSGEDPPPEGEWVPFSQTPPPPDTGIEVNTQTVDAINFVGLDVAVDAREATVTAQPSPEPTPADLRQILSGRSPLSLAVGSWQNAAGQPSLVTTIGLDIAGRVMLGGAPQRVSGGPIAVLPEEMWPAVTTYSPVGASDGLIHVAEIRTDGQLDVASCPVGSFAFLETIAFRPGVPVELAQAPEGAQGPWPNSDLEPITGGTIVIDAYEGIHPYAFITKDSLGKRTIRVRGVLIQSYSGGPPNPTASIAVRVPLPEGGNWPSTGGVVGSMSILGLNGSSENLQTGGQMNVYSDIEAGWLYIDGQDDTPWIHVAAPRDGSTTEWRITININITEL